MIKKLLDYFLNWLFSIGADLGKEKEDTLKSSIKGSPLVVISTGGGICIKQTDKGMKGALIGVMICQFGESIEDMKRVILGECDDYLSQEDKDNIVGNIKRRAEEQGRYIDLKRNKKGTLDPVEKHWSKKDLEQIKKLLLNYDGGDNAK